MDKMNHKDKLNLLLAEANKLTKNNITDKTSHPGIKNTKNVQNKSKKSNDASYKDTEKVMKDYDKASTSDIDGNFVPPKNEVASDGGNMGQQDIVYDNINDEFIDRATKAIEGDSTMGNEDTEATEGTPDTKNPNLGKDFVKKAKEKRDTEVASTRTSRIFGKDYEVEDGDSIAKNKKIAVESTDGTQSTKKRTMKRLRFKKPFNGMENAVKLIPENYREDKKTFELTDGVETYRVRWEGDLTEGKAIVLTAKNDQLIKEDLDKISHLMGFKSEDTLGRVKGHNRVDEDKIFNDILGKTKKIISEDNDEKTTV